MNGPKARVSLEGLHLLRTPSYRIFSATSTRNIVRTFSI